MKAISRSKKSDRLKRALIVFHWQSILEDNGKLGVTEIEARMKRISWLRSRLADPSQVELNFEALRAKQSKTQNR